MEKLRSTFKICDALCNLVPFLQFKKREKHSWTSLLLAKSLDSAHNLLKVTLLRRCFSRFLNCTNGTKSRNVFVFVMIPWFTKSVTSWWILVYEIRYIFLNIFFWTTTNQVTKLGQLMNISQGNNFLESFEQFGRLGLSSSPF